MSAHALIVFQKNPGTGKVKPRKGSTAAIEKNLETYQELIRHAHTVIRDTPADKFIFYSDFLEPADASYYNEEIQAGACLGERMRNAFNEVFRKGYRKAVIIGTGCRSVTADLINQSFTLLEKSDVVIGPTRNGGYYLLGMKELHLSLFQNKEWTGDTVLQDTLADLESQGLKYHLLPRPKNQEKEPELAGFQLWH